MNSPFPFAYLIDDDPLSNQILAKVLEDKGFFTSVVSSTSAKEALVYFTECSEENKPFPDIIFLDLSMPDVDGWEFIDRFKAAFGKRAHSKIVILSGSQRWADLVQGEMSDHVDYFMKKPVTAGELETMVSDLK